MGTMVTMVTSTIDTHVTRQRLTNPHQWVCKKGHSTESLLVKITDDWRRALDKKYVEGRVFLTCEKRLTRVSTPFYYEKIRVFV